MSFGSEVTGTPVAADSATGLGPRFWALIGATFLGFLGFGTVLPGLAPYVKHRLGGSDETVGFVVGIFSFVALAGRLISGPLADRRGRKICFLAGLCCCICAGGTYLLPIGLASVYGGRMLQGMGEACLYTGAATWVVEVAGVERSGRALGFLSSAIWGGVSAGPVVGQWIGSFRHAALLQVLTASISLAVVLLIPEHYHYVHHEAARHWLPKRLIVPGLAVGLVNVHYPVIAGFLILHLASHGNSGPPAFAAYALLIMLSRFFLGGLPDRMHPAITYNMGIGIMAVGLTAIAFGPPPYLAIASAALLGFGFSFPWSAVAATLMRNTPAGERGSTISILSAFYDLFVGTSSFAAGIVAHRFGYPAAFFLAVGALILAAIVGRIVFHPESSIFHDHGQAQIAAEALTAD